MNGCIILSATFCWKALANPEKPIRQLSVLTTDERERVLYTFNRTGRYLEERSVFDALGNLFG